MDYKKAYLRIINEAKTKKRSREEGIIYENHHVIPKCMGGTNKKDNLVLLLPREHFVCHNLLTKIYPEHKGLLYAFHMMSTVKSKHLSYNVSSRQFESAKIQIREYLTSLEIKRKKADTRFNKKFSPQNVKKMVDIYKNTTYNPDCDFRSTGIKVY